VLAITVAVLRLLPNDVLVYEQKYQAFVSRDSLALTAYNEMTHAGSDQREAWRNKAIGYWQQGIELTAEMGKLHLPQPLAERNFRLQTYCLLRIQQTDVAYRSVNGEPGRARPPYTDSLKTLEDRVDSLEKTLGDAE
jgi:hypothetical protein